MSIVRDDLGRVFDFDKIRWKMDEKVLQQAISEITDETTQRAQTLFDRYILLHRIKYRRAYEPGHFKSGRLRDDMEPLYSKPQPMLRITIDVKEGALLERFVGAPVDIIEAEFKRDPINWVKQSRVVAIEK
jgi:hypothetical protein